MTINLTDPSNHPANGPLTAERIERVIEALQRSIQYQNGGDMAYVIADAIKGLEELLVSKEAESEPVPDEELEQMIWKLERDGMTPKLLSLMRELREWRRAKGEPVAWTNEESLSGVGIDMCGMLGPKNAVGDIALYTVSPALESRTVTVKLMDVRDHQADVNDKILALAFRRLAEGVRQGDVAAMRAAGIQVIEGEA